MSYLIQDDHSDTVPQDQTERLFGRAAEVGPVDGCEDIGVPVDELHELLQTPEAAFTEAEEDLHRGLVRPLLLEFVLDVLEERSDGLDDGDDERPECESSRVIPYDDDICMSRLNPNQENVSFLSTSMFCQSC